MKSRFLNRLGAVVSGLLLARFTTGLTPADYFGRKMLEKLGSDADGFHFCAAGYRILGERYADKMISLMGKQ